MHVLMTGYVRCLAALIVSASVIRNAFGLDSHSYRFPFDLATLPPDVDRDGVPDTWGTRHGLDSGKASDHREGADGDGRTNIEGYLNGTDLLGWAKLLLGAGRRHKRRAGSQQGGTPNSSARMCSATDGTAACTSADISVENVKGSATSTA